MQCTSIPSTSVQGIITSLNVVFLSPMNFQYKKIPISQPLLLQAMESGTYHLPFLSLISPHLWNGYKIPLCLLHRIVMRVINAQSESTLSLSTETIVLLLDGVCQQWQTTWFMHSPVPDKSIQWAFVGVFWFFKIPVASGTHSSPWAS